MSKKVTQGKGAMEAMLRGLDKAADSVASTVGPKGRNVYITDNLTPRIVNDGVTIANKIILADPEEDAGAYVIRNVCSQQLDDVGDGTTTVAILTQSIVHEALKRPENPMEIKESLHEAGQKMLKELVKGSIKLKKSDIKRVALISSENEELAKLISEIVLQLGEKAVINVEDSKTFATGYEVVDGYEAGVGYFSPHFITDKKLGRAILEDVPVFVTERKISNIVDIRPLFEQFKEQGISQCVIACDDIDDSMLGLFVQNKAMGTFTSLVLRTGGEILEDIAGTTGATIISDKTGIPFKDVKLTHLGKAKKVVSEVNKTLFVVEGVASKLYANELEGRREGENNMWLKKHYEDRINRIKGGIAQLRIGASTDLEREYLKLKAEDAIKATKAAMEEGVVPGGGMAFWHLSQDETDKSLGASILRRALKAPLRKIIENSGKDYDDVVMGLNGSGYDAKNGAYCDMLVAGILDPVKVERIALENAISAAGIFLTTGTLITDHDETKKQTGT